MRIIVRAETRAAVAGLKELDVKIHETAANAEAASTQLDSASGSVTSLGNASNSARAGVSAVTAGLAGMGIAAVVATGIGFLVEKIISMHAASKAAAEAQKEFVSLLDDSAKSAADNAEKVTTLVDALQSGTLNTGQRKKALDELKAQNEEYFGQLSEEKGTIVGLTNAYEAYLGNLSKIGAAKAIEIELTKLFDKKLQLQLSIDPKFLTATSKEAQADLARLEDQLTKLGGPVSGLKENQSLVGLNDNLRKRIELTRQIAELQAGYRTAPSREVDQTNEDIKAIDLRIKGLAAFQQALGVFNIVPVKDKAKQALTETHDLILSRIDPDLVDPFIQGFKTLDERMKHLPPPKGHIFNYGPAIKDDIQAETDKINTSINNSLHSIAETFAEGLGSLIAGKGFDSLVSGLGRTIGEGLKSIGKILIEAGIQLQLVQKAALELAHAHPVLAVVAGIAAIAAGVAIENATQRKIGATAFAEGGIVTGPTYSLIGEKGPEVVFPLNQLNKFVRGVQGSADRSLTGNVVVKGTDLSIVLARTNKNQGLVS